MLIQAQPVTLSWDRIYLMVYIRSFDPDYRFARIPYRISCEVLQDLTTPDDINAEPDAEDRKSTRLNSSHQIISYAVFCLKKKKYQIEYNHESHMYEE